MVAELKVTDYTRICSHITELITLSGLKLEYVRKQLGYSKPGFYKKRKSGKFTPEELTILLRILRVEAEPRLFEEMLERLENRQVPIEAI